MADEQMLTVLQAAAQLSVSRAWMYRMLQRGQIASVGTGRARRVPASAVSEYQAAQRPLAVGPVGLDLTGDIEERAGQTGLRYRARVRWKDPATGRRDSRSQSFDTAEEAAAWVERMREAAAQGVDPRTATMTLAEYGALNLQLVLRDVEASTTDPYLAGWRLRVVPALGHLPVAMIRYGAVDRAVLAWISDGTGRSSVKNTLAVLVRVMEQAVRDGIIDKNPARITGWQRQYQLIEDELDDLRALALPNWNALTRLAAALVKRSAGEHQVWGDVVIFEACTASRIGEVSGVRVKDIDTDKWVWNVRRQTTPAPGGLVDKNTKGKRARKVPIIAEIRDMVEARIAAVDREPDARLFTGPRGGRITTAVLRDATHWDEVVVKLGYEHLRRHDLRHTGLTWMADAGVPVHHLQRIAGHGSLTTTQRYLHPDQRSVTDAGERLSQHLSINRSGPDLRIVR